MEQIFSDIPPPIPDFSIQSISPSPGSLSPADSTLSIEFLKEFLASPPHNHFLIHPDDIFDPLVNRFPRATQSLPPNAYIIGPDYFNPNEIRNAIAEQPLHAAIPVFLP